MKEILWIFVPTKENIQQSNGMIFLLWALIGLMIWFAIQIPTWEANANYLKVMPCSELKTHILKEDFVGVPLWEQEHQYTWRCDK